MTCGQLINQIAQINRSAGTQFLAQFSEAQLENYLARLLAVKDAFEAQFHQQYDQLPAEQAEQQQQEEPVLAAC